MSSKIRKHLKFVPQLFTILGALSMAFAMLLSVVNVPVLANGGVVDWEGNGSENLPCNGAAQWNFTGGKDVTSAVLTVNGQNYGMDQTGGVWKADVSGLGTEVDAYVTYTGDLGNGNAVLTISHCTKDETPGPTNTPVSPTLTPSNTPTNTQVPPTNTPTFTPTNTPTNTPTDTPTLTPTNTAVPDDPTQTPGGPTATHTSPNSPYSDFVDLSNPSRVINATELFYEVYTTEGSLVLQTCIAQGSELSWGRLFIQAVPVDDVSFNDLINLQNQAQNLLF